MRRFRIEQPASTADARAILRQEDASLYAGGTELLLAMKDGFLDYDCLVDVKGLPGMTDLEVDVDAGVIRIGAAVSHRRIERNAAVRDQVPILAEVEAHVGNVRVRNTGTIGGNLCFAEPHSDIAALSLLLDAHVVVVGDERRTMSAADLIAGPYETTLDPTEVLERLDVPIPPPGSGIGYSRFKLNERPLAVAGVRLEADAGVVHRAMVVVGSLEPVPSRQRDAELALVGRPIGELDVAGEEVARLVAAAVDVFEDHEGSERYKRHLAGVLVRRACATAVERLDGGMG